MSVSSFPILTFREIIFIFRWRRKKFTAASSPILPMCAVVVSLFLKNLKKLNIGNDSLLSVIWVKFFGRLHLTIFFGAKKLRSIF